MIEVPYSNDEKRCAGCGYPIAYNWVPDPKSKREDPSYYHITCFNQMEVQREAIKQSSNTRLHSQR